MRRFIAIGSASATRSTIDSRERKRAPLLERYIARFSITSKSFFLPGLVVKSCIFLSISSPSRPNRFSSSLSLVARLAKIFSGEVFAAAPIPPARLHERRCGCRSASATRRPRRPLTPVYTPPPHREVSTARLALCKDLATETIRRRPEAIRRLERLAFEHQLALVSDE